MKSNADKLRHKTAQHKQTKRRKYVRKAKLLLPILGILCLIVALMLLGISFFMSAKVMQHRWQYAASAYGSVGLILLLIKYILEWMTGWRARRRRTIRSGESPEQ